ncbi:PEP-CTERM sorting domain-containing protein [Chitiniphilus purpureus]|uniref:PEP-CTERM sorting domain-containing protein n=1 Tax=Chitiniphilus purpureus TaxID=2981137 RepID=A0ABY6DTA0_9NEIS|nr:PEP-CTERM sorting domain-containing protein [Chitiniphilus sp. CD1]UXY15088.1 PEP-CTERM sorting domain-containing protein [Chitiniphilus sp. CD1]
MRLLKLTAIGLLMSSAAVQAAYNVIEARNVRYYVDMDDAFIQGLAVSLDQEDNLVFTPTETETILESNQRGHGATSFIFRSGSDFIMAEAKRGREISRTFMGMDYSFGGTGQLKPAFSQHIREANASIAADIEAYSLENKNGEWQSDFRWSRGYDVTERAIYKNSGGSYTADTLLRSKDEYEWGTRSSFAGRVGMYFELQTWAVLTNPLSRDSTLSARLSSFHIGVSTVPVSPVPEPETYGLMSLGLVGVLAMRRRRTRYSNAGAE